MEDITLRGIIEHIIYRNDENGYTVLEFTTQDRENDGQVSLLADFSITAVGVLPAIAEGETVTLHGQWTEHREYGKQFKIKHCEMVMPEDEEAIEKYLAGGFIKGVRAVTARNIVRAFGVDSLWIIEQQPHRLAEVKGISMARAEQIAQSYAEHAGTRNTLMQLQQFGLTPHQALLLSKQYGADTLNVLQENPYQIIRDVSGIGFRLADQIAQNVGIGVDSIQRIQAGLYYTLQWARNEGGHTCFPEDTLCDLASRSLGLPYEHVSNALQDMILANELIVLQVDQMSMVALPRLFRQESHSAYQLLSLCTHPSSLPLFDISQQLAALERESGILLDDMQRNAIMDAFERGILIITGGPGTGKTTIIHFILSLMEQLDLNCELCAPTGRAAKRMSEATARPARTIHRLLEYTGQSFTRDASNPLDCDVLIVDEMSMVDTALFFHLLSAIPEGTRIIFAGDADQLPSVGPGNVLKDMIGSDILPVIHLTQVFRQARLSRIVTNAHKINQGEMPLLDFTPDFAFEAIQSNEVILQRILGICQRGKLGDPWTDIQILSPTKKGLLGVNNLNEQLQNVLNPKSKGKDEISRGSVRFRDGDKVMQIRNDYTIEWTRPGKRETETGTGVFNGDMGVITRIDFRDQLVHVLFDDERRACYEFNQLDHLDLAYAISIHKSQGSEFPIVLMPMFMGPPMLMTRNLLYTAITRARECVVLIGRQHAIASMVQNVQEKTRFSALKHTLWSLCPVFGLEPPADFLPDSSDEKE